MFFSIISILFLSFYTTLMLYYRYGWSTLRLFTPDPDAPLKKNAFISVIIVARNEEKNIEACLTSIANQTLGSREYEMILVDDHSTDRTIELAENLKLHQLQIINLKDSEETMGLNSYKKFGISKAIEQCGGELIVTTDADCIVPDGWLEHIRKFYVMRAPVFIAAPVIFNHDAHESIAIRLLVIFQQLDFMVLQGITGASVKMKFHNMCNGANLAYARKAFIEVNGFEGIDDIASGDDMLLMSKVEKVFHNKIGYLKSKSTIVTTEPALTLKDFINQRIRWASKAGRYSDFRITSVLLLVYIFNAWLFMTFILGLFSAMSFKIFLVLLIVKTLVELFFLYPVARFFGKLHLLWWFVPAQPFHILYTIIAGGLGKFGYYEWKGRRVK